jgi:segregation and condensation protein B
MVMLSIESQIEAILFFRAEPVKLTKLASLLEETPEIVREGLDKLRVSLSGRGLALVETNEEVLLGTNPELASLIEKLTRDDLTTDIGKAGLETLSLVLYRSPITRSEIDYVRGVNSGYILRHLLIRGLIERESKAGETRGFVYRPSMNLLQHLGLSRQEDLPEYAEVQAKVKDFITSQNAAVGQA